MVRVAGGWYIPAFHFFFWGGPSFTFFVNLPNCLYMIERDLTEMKRTGFWSEEIFIVFLHNPTSSSLGAPFFFKKKKQRTTHAPTWKGNVCGRGMPDSSRHNLTCFKKHYGISREIIVASLMHHFLYLNNHKIYCLFRRFPALLPPRFRYLFSFFFFLFLSYLFYAPMRR